MTSTIFFTGWKGDLLKYSLEGKYLGSILIPNFNDGETNASLLVALLKNKLVHVNVIPVNPLIGQGESFKDAEEFARLLQGKLNVTVRRSRGADIDAACGQLKRKVLD